MFGYVTIYRKELSEQDLDRYQAYYCGLCTTLGQRHGAAARLALSYDMTFAALLLAALYEPATELSQGRCLPHPVRSRPRAANDCLAYAADMTVALAYYNELDNWQDEGRRASLQRAKMLERQLPAVEQAWPRQMAAIRGQLQALNALEQANSHDLDALCAAFGTLLGAVFAWKEDVWAPTLQAVGRGLGGFIYLMDAYDDLEKDRRRGQFNALAALADTLPPDEYETRCEELLRQQMGLCAQAFELLPILKDTPEGRLLYNTIYAGVWSRYRPLRTYRERHRT